MSYISYFLEKTGWKFLETWEFSEGCFLAYCETTHLGEQIRFYALFSGYSHMLIPDDIGDKLSGKIEGTKNDHAS